jgi:hypothetical protein
MSSPDGPRGSHRVPPWGSKRYPPGPYAYKPPWAQPHYPLVPRQRTAAPSVLAKPNPTGGGRCSVRRRVCVLLRRPLKTPAKVLASVPWGRTLNRVAGVWCAALAAVVAAAWVVFSNTSVAAQPPPTPGAGRPGAPPPAQSVRQAVNAWLENGAEAWIEAVVLDAGAVARADA